MCLVRHSRWMIAIAVFLVALLLNTAGNGQISLWDRDEPRYAQASRQMLQSGDWVVPRFNHKNRYDKPPLVYWLMAACMSTTGVSEFSARMPAALAGAGTTLLVFLLCGSMGGSLQGALLAAAIAGSSILLLIISKASTTDSVLVFLVTAMMALLWRQKARGFSWSRHLLFYTFLAAGVLLKGPPAPLVVGLAAVSEMIWRRRAGDASVRKVHATGLFRTVTGAALFFGLSLPWAVLAWRQTGGEYFMEAIGHHVFERSTSPMEGHGGPFLLSLPYYIPVVLFGVFPWTAPVVLGLRTAWRGRREAASRFLLCWLLFPLVAFSVVMTKLPHYVAPLFPALAVMAGLWLAAPLRKEDARPSSLSRLSSAGARTTFWLATLLGVGLIGAALYLRFPRVIAPAFLGGAILVTGAFLGNRLWQGERREAALVTWGLIVAAFASVLFLFLLPAVEPLKPSPIIISWIRENAPPSTRLAAAGYREPTLVFYWTTPVEMLGNSESDEALGLLSDVSSPATLLITAERWRKWLNEEPALAAFSDSVKHRQRFYRFQRGHWLELLVIGNWRRVSR